LIPKFASKVPQVFANFGIGTLVVIRKIVAALILVPIAIVVVTFAVANRQTVVVSFDPFDQAHPAFTLALPLFALLLAVAIAGVVIGGFAAWIRQRKWRRAARLAQAQTRELNAQLDQLNRHMGVSEPREEMPGRYASPLRIPPPAA
jgi:uncharacterized integral membrane protein